MSFTIVMRRGGAGGSYAVDVDALDCPTVMTGAQTIAQSLSKVPVSSSWCAGEDGVGDNVGPVGPWWWLEFGTEGAGGYYSFVVDSVTASTSAGVDPAVIADLQTTVSTLQSTVETTQQTVTQTASTVSEMQTGLQSLLNAAAEDFDPVFAGAVFGFFYCTVFVFYSISKGIGAVLGAIKGG